MALSQVQELMKNPAKMYAETQNMDMLATLVEANEDIHISTQLSIPTV